MPEYRFMTPIEMPRGTHYGNNYSVAYSTKLKRKVTAYSNLEFDHLTTLEMDPAVEYYCEQPLQVTVFLSGKEKKTTFDAWVQYRDGREEFRETKYTADIMDKSDNGNRCREQIEAQKAWCLQNGFIYTLQTEKDIYKGVMFIQNLSVLAARVRRFEPVSQSAENALRTYLKEMERATVGFLSASGHFEKDRILSMLAYFYYKGIIDFDDIKNTLISNTSEVIYIGN